MAAAAASGVAATCALGASAARADGAAAHDAPADEIVLYHTNDTHGYLQGDGASVVGIDYVAGLRRATPHSLLVDAGDATQGMPLASLEKGASVITLMNSAGYDAMCLGNHEFDFGLDRLRAHAEAAQFPLLGANVLKDGAPLLEGIENAAGAVLDGCSTILECAGRKIGVFGLTTTATAWLANPEYVGGLEFVDEVETAERQIESLAGQGADAIVALCHLGNGPVPCKAADLAALLSDRAASRLAAIVDGHSHTVENMQVNGVLVVQTGCNLAAVGKLTLSFGPDGSVDATEELLDPAACAAAAAPSADVAADLEVALADQNALMSEVLFDNPTALWAGWLSESAISAPTRMVETNFGDVATEALADRAAAYLRESGQDDATPVVAFENGGGIRAALPRGAVSKGHLVTAFPFSNTVVLKRVTPRVLRELFEGSFSTMAGQDAQTGMLLQESVSGGFLQFAGCSVCCDPNAAVGQRVRSITLDGAEEPLDLDDSETPIVLVSNSYVMAGGDTYAALADIDVLAEVGGELEAIEDHLVGLAAPAAGADAAPSLPLFAGTRGRLDLRGGYEPAAWTATVRLMGAGGSPLPGYAITLEVDAADRFDTVSDENGLVRLEVSDGAHAVCQASDEPDMPMPEVYVDNYMGFGLVEDELRAYPQIMVMGEE